MSEVKVSYDSVSEDPRNFSAVFERAMSLASDVRAASVTVDQAEAEAKALHVGTQVLRFDLHRRVFEHKLTSRSLPTASEGSDAAQLTG
jgi:hypothetical protein